MRLQNALNKLAADRSSREEQNSTIEIQGKSYDIELINYFGTYQTQGSGKILVKTDELAFTVESFVDESIEYQIIAQIESTL